HQSLLLGVPESRRVPRRPTFFSLIVALFSACRSNATCRLPGASPTPGRSRKHPPSSKPPPPVFASRTRHLPLARGRKSRAATGGRCEAGVVQRQGTDLLKQ